MNFILSDEKNSICFYGLENISKLFLLFEKNKALSMGEMFFIKLIQKEGEVFDTEYGKFVYKQKRCFDCMVRGEELNKDCPTITISWDNKKTKRNLYNVIYSEQIKNFGGEYEFKEVAETLL